MQNARGKRGQPDQPSHKGQDAGHDSKEQRASDSSARPKPEDQAETERDKNSEPKRRGRRLAAACAKEQPSQDTSCRPNDQWKQLLDLGRKGHHHAKPERLRRVRQSIFGPTVAVVRRAVKPTPRRACLRQKERSGNRDERPLLAVPCPPPDCAGVTGITPERRGSRGVRQP